MIPVVVVGHPRREKLAIKLAAAIQADAIVWDVGHLGAAKNHLQAWKWLAEEYDSEWGAVLEDDVIPCSHFRRNLEEALQHAPSNFLSLYLGRGRPPHRQQDIASVITAPVSFYTDDTLLSAQGYAARVDTFHCYDRVIRRAQKSPIDEAISSWARSSGFQISYCRHSLVNHIDGPTLVANHGDGQRRNGKTALWTPDCDPSGKELPEVRKAWLLAGTDTDWTQGVRALPTDGRGAGHGIRGTSRRFGGDQAATKGSPRAGAKGSG